MRNTISKMVLVLIVFAITNLALADEGMWLLNNLPAAELKAKYNFTLLNGLSESKKARLVCRIVQHHLCLPMV